MPSNIFVLFLSLLTVSVCLGQHDELKPAEASRAQELAENYLENESKFKRFAVALRVECSNEFFDGSQKDSATQDWYLHICDSEKKRVRHVEIVSREVLTRDGLGFQQTQVPITLIFGDGEVRQMLGRNTSASLSPDAEEALLEEALKRQTNFNPWELPLLGTELLVPRRSALPFRSDFLAKARVNYAKEILGGVEVSFYYTETVSLIMRFEKKFGDLPTQVDLYVKDAVYDGVIRAIRTKWEKHSDGWLPMEILVVDGKGPPGNISRKITRHFFGDWILGDGFPDAVFGHDNATAFSALELRRLIVQRSDISP